MTSLGTLPANIPALNILESIGENVIISDADYNVVWVNPTAAELLSHVAPLFGADHPEQVIGMNMRNFHRQPSYQENIMKGLTKSHRARINIKDRFITDIVINPILNNEEITGYVVMLMDVTTKSQEEERKEKLIKELSVPIISVWKDTIAIPLFGELDHERGELLLSRVLEKCTKARIQYVLLDVTGVSDFAGNTLVYMKRLYDCVRLIGAECLIVGISPKLAIDLSHQNISFRTFNSSQKGLEYIMSVSTTKGETMKTPEKPKSSLTRE